MDTEHTVLAEQPCNCSFATKGSRELDGLRGTGTGKIRGRGTGAEWQRGHGAQRGWGTKREAQRIKCGDKPEKNGKRNVAG